MLFQKWDCKNLASNSYPFTILRDVVRFGVRASFEGFDLSGIPRLRWTAVNGPPSFEPRLNSFVSVR